MAIRRSSGRRGFIGSQKVCAPRPPMAIYCHWETNYCKAMEKPKIIAYLKPTCGWSNGVRAVLKKYDLPYEDRDIINDPAQRQEMVEKSGQMLSPCVEIDGQMLADISGEEVEAWMLANNVVQPNDPRTRSADRPGLRRASTPVMSKQLNLRRSQTAATNPRPRRVICAACLFQASAVNLSPCESSVPSPPCSAWPDNGNAPADASVLCRRWAICTPAT